MRFLSTLITLLLVAFSATIFAQQREVISLSKDELIAYTDHSSNLSSSAAMSVPLSDVKPFLAFSVVWEGAQNMSMTVYFLRSDGMELFTYNITENEHTIDDDNRHVSHLYFIDKEVTTFNIETNIATNSELENVEIHFYNPNETIANQAIDRRTLEDCECPQPDFEGRLDWCPTGNCPIDATPVNTNVTHLIVHHSAGGNTSTDWAARVRSIWDYHVNTNGWDDVGYNWLIDPEGVLYEGRGDNHQGAHFCGKNAGTMGICMIGTYIDVEPTMAAMTTLKELLAWKAADRDLNPLGEGYHASSMLELMHIVGHRDGCSTTCPGDMLYAQLPALRDDVADYVAVTCSAPNSPTNIDALLTNNSTVLLSWQDNANNETGYRVERKEAESDDFEALATVPANTESYTDTGLLPGKTYYYQAVALNGTLASTCQIEAEVSTPGTNTTNTILPADEVQLSPNPTSAIFQVQLENEYRGDLQIDLLDVTGKAALLSISLEKTNFALRHDISLTKLPAGLYWVRISQGDLTGIFKVIKQ